MGDYMKIENNEGKTWIFPRRNMKAALEIYQPVTIKGKALKFLFPAINMMGMASVICTEADLNEIIPTEVLQAIDHTFGKNSYELSYFSGSPGTHMKPTIQVFSGSKILGYVKYTIKSEIAELFRNEERILNYLNSKGISSIPKCLLNDNYGEYYVFIQNTKKKIHAKSVHRMSVLYFDFLREIYAKTRKELIYTETDFYKTLVDLRKKIIVLPDYDQELIERAIDRVNAFYMSKKNVGFGVCHRDFTPWNTCLDDNKLYVFDWEYARETYPRGMDMARLYVELKRREERKSNESIIKEYKKEKKSLLSITEYLLDNIYIFLERGKSDDMQIVNLSLELLRRV